MDYRNILDKVDQAGSFHIEHLAYIALDLEMRSDAMENIFDDLYSEDVERMFPEIKSMKWYSGTKDLDAQEVLDIVTDLGKFGFIAQIGVHQKDKFTFDEDGDMRSCTVYEGLSYVTYAYGDTIEELIDQIKERCDHYERLDIKKFKEKQEK